MSKISVVVGVSGGNLSRKHVLNVEIDYTGVEQKQILEWATDSRVIALQRALRATDDAHLEKMATNTLRVHATACGGKIETPAEKIAKLVAAGMPEQLAKLSIENPTMFAKLMDSAAGSVKS